MPRSGSYLGSSLGCRDPDHIARLGRRHERRQGQTALHSDRNDDRSAPCRRVPLKFAEPCSIHCRGAKRIEVDQLRLVWLQRKLRRNFFNVRERAARSASVKNKAAGAALVVED